MLFLDNIIQLPQVDSTNNYAKQLIEEGTGEGTAVLSQFQSMGKGQAGNSWESEEGKNLLCSLILYPEFLPAEKQFQLSKIISLSIAEFLAAEVSGVKIKWPNDVYVGDMKIGGILIENSIIGMTLSSSVLGFGLNLNQMEFHSPAPNPVSLIQLTQKQYGPEQVYQQIAENLNRWYNVLKESTGSEQIDNAYWSSLYRADGWYNFSAGDKQFSARITGIGNLGQLQLEKKDGSVQEFMFKEVEFI